MRFRVPDDMTGLVIEHQQFETQELDVTLPGKPAQKINTMKVPDRFDATMKSLGYERIGFEPPTAADPHSAAPGGPASAGRDAVAFAVSEIEDVAKRATAKK